MITSSQNPEIKFLSALAKRKYREKNRVYVIEGLRIIEDALLFGGEFVKFFYSSAMRENLRSFELLKMLREAGVPEILVEEKLFNQIARTKTPQGFLAILRQPDFTLEDLLTHKSLYRHIILINEVQDPGNLGTILRTVAAAGWLGALLTTGTVDLYNPKSLQATMGAIHRLPICKLENWADVLTKLRTTGYQIIATDVSAKELYYQVDFKIPSVVVVGNEGHGIDDHLLNQVDRLVKIPLAPDAESLNVGIATGIVVYEGVRQNLLAGI